MYEYVEASSPRQVSRNQRYTYRSEINCNAIMRNLLPFKKLKKTCRTNDLGGRDSRCYIELNIQQQHLLSVRSSPTNCLVLRLNRRAAPVHHLSLNRLRQVRRKTFFPGPRSPLYNNQILFPYH